MDAGWRRTLLFAVVAHHSAGSQSEAEMPGRRRTDAGDFSRSTARCRVPRRSLFRPRARGSRGLAFGQVDEELANARLTRPSTKPSGVASFKALAQPGSSAPAAPVPWRAVAGPSRPTRAPILPPAVPPGSTPR